MSDFGGTSQGASTDTYAGHCRSIVLDPMPEDGTLVSVTIQHSTYTVSPLNRCGLFKNPTSTTDFSGMTLVEDLGQGGQVWTSATSPALSTGDVLVIVFKEASSHTGSAIVYYDSSDPGDDLAAPGRTLDAEQGSDPTAAWTSPGTIAGTAGTEWYSAYITYTPAGGGAPVILTAQGILVGEGPLLGSGPLVR